MPSHPQVILLLPLACFLLLLLYGRGAVHFYYSGRVIEKPVMSLRAIAAFSLCFLALAAVALLYSPRLQPPPFPPTNVIRCALPAAAARRRAQFPPQRIRSECVGLQLAMRSS